MKNWISEKILNRFFGVKVKFGDGKKPEVDLYTSKMESEPKKNKKAKSNEI